MSFQRVARDGSSLIAKSDCNNDMFEKCSEEWHRLQSLLAFRKSQKGRIPLHRLSIGDSCVSSTNGGTGVQSTFTHWTCERHYPPGINARLNMSLAKAMTILLCPEEDLWMACIKSKTPKSAFLFSTSHWCNMVQRPFCCLTKGHFGLETIQENNVRKGHHSGRYGCFCEPACQGGQVFRKTFTVHDRAITESAY